MANRNCPTAFSILHLHCIQLLTKNTCSPFILLRESPIRVGDRNFWLDIASLNDFREVISELRLTISERFEENGYEMASLQRDVHLDVKYPLTVNVRTPTDIGQS